MSGPRLIPGGHPHSCGQPHLRYYFAPPGRWHSPEHAWGLTREASTLGARLDPPVTPPLITTTRSLADQDVQNKKGKLVP
jgi:hypothetical protein